MITEKRCRTILQFAFLLIFVLLPILIFAQTLPYGLSVFDMRDGLPQMKVNDVVEDQKGNLWLATRGGLSKFDGEKFTNYTTREGLLSDRVHGVTLTQEQHIAVLTVNGLSIFDGAKFRHFPQSFLEVKYQMVVRPDSSLWIISNQAIWELKADSLYLADYLLPYPEKNGLLYDPAVDAICCTSKNAYFCFLNKKWTFIRKGTARQAWEKIKVLGHIDQQILFVKQKNREEVSFGHYIQDDFKPGLNFKKTTNELSIPEASGIYALLNDRLLYNTKRGDKIDLNYNFNHIHKIIETSSGHLVIASDVGLGVIPPFYFKTINNPALSNIWTIGQGPDNNMYAFSYQQGVARITPDDFQVQKVQDKSTQNVNYFLGAAQNTEGHLFIPNSRGYTKITDKEICHVPTVEGNFTLGYDPVKNKILRGTYGGLAFLNEDSSTTLVDTSFGIHPNYYIQSIAVDTKGRYWMGSYSGLSYYNPQNKKAINFSFSDSSFFNDGAYGIYADDEDIWIGNSNGLVYGNINTLSFKSINSEIINSMVKSIIPFNDSTLLVGCKNGLYLFNATKYLHNNIIETQSLNTSLGFTGIEPHFNGLYKDTQKRIWIASANELSVLLPKLPIPLTSFSMQPNILGLNDTRLPIQHSNLTISLSKGIDDLRIYWEASGIIRPDQVLCQWKINNGPWSDWTDESPIRLNDLGHGHYRFHLRVGPTDLPDTQTWEDTITFQVYLPFYGRSWFKWVVSLLALAFLGASLYGTIRNRIARNKYTEKLKENNYLKNQLLLTELNPHFIFNALSSIQYKILAEDKIKASQQLVRLSKLIRAFLSSTHRSYLSNLPSDDILISLAEELQLIRYYLDFELEKSNGKFSYEIRHMDATNLDSLFIPPMLLQPLVENAIKHGIFPLQGKGEIKITIEEEENRLKICIEDNGVGMEASKAQHMDKALKKQSLGHQIIKERIRVLAALGHPIDMFFQNPENGGTRINLIIYQE